MPPRFLWHSCPTTPVNLGSDRTVVLAPKAHEVPRSGRAAVAAITYSPDWKGTVGTTWPRRFGRAASPPTRLPSSSAGQNAPSLRASAAAGLNAAKRRQHQLRALTGEGLSAGQMMELKFGPGAQGSLFSSSEELRHGWEASRDEIMRGSSGGHRAQAWWCFDAPSLALEWPGYFNEQSYLFDHNALGEEECAELVAFWRREFERAYDPDFSYTAAP